MQSLTAMKFFLLLTRDNGVLHRKSVTHMFHKDIFCVKNIIRK